MLKKNCNKKQNIFLWSNGERQLMEGLAAGQTNLQLGLQTHRSEKTVRNQLTRLYARLGARNRAEAVAIYLREHALPPDFAHPMPSSDGQSRGHE